MLLYIKVSVEHKTADDFCPDMSSFLNPDTYLNHLPPADAEGFEVARNVLLAVLGVGLSSLRLYLSVKRSSV
jgi:hypothetical protein